VENSHFEENLTPVDTMTDNRTVAEMLPAPTEGGRGRGYGRVRGQGRRVGKAEQNNELLMKNHETRPTGITHIPEANVSTYYDHNAVVVMTVNMDEVMIVVVVVVVIKGVDFVEGYAEAIVVPLILAEQFELKHSLINMMTTDQFFGLEKDNPHDHIRWFNKITSTVKYKDVPNSAIKLMLFMFSLAGAARRTTNLRNEISNFQQRFDELFHEAWDRYKDLHRACSHHGFTELHQLDTFYNAINPAGQDSLNAAAGGNLLERRTQDVLTIIENKYKIAKLTHAVNQQTSAVTTAMTAILKQFQATPPPASVKAVEEICVTYGGAHPYYQCLAVGGNTFPELRDNIQGYVSAAAVNYNHGSGSLPSNTVANPKCELKAITTRSGLVLDGPTVPTPLPFINPKEDKCVEETLTDPDLSEYTIKVPPPPKMLKALLSNKEKLQELENTPLNENCSAVILKKLPEKLRDHGKFLILCGFNELKCKALADLGTSINLMPLSVWKKLSLPELISTRMTLELANRAICTPAGIARDVFVPVSKFTFSADFVIVDYESDPRVPLILGRPFLRTAHALIDVHGEEMILRDGDERLTLNMRHDTSSYSSQPRKESINLINVFNNSNNMSRDVLTVGSSMRILLLYRGEYSQWVERFMNYLEEQTDGEAMINSIKNGDQPSRVTQVSIAGTSSTEQPPLKDKSMCNKTEKDLWDALAWHMLGSEYGEQDRKAAVLYEYETFKATEGELLLDTYIWQNKNLMDINIDALYNILKQNQGDVNDAMGSKKKTIVVTSDPLALIAKKTKVSKSKEKVVVSSDSKGSDADDFSELKKITALFATAFNRRKFYSKPTNNNLRTSSTSQSANKKQEFVKNDNKKVKKKDDEKKRDMSRVKCYNYKKEAHFAKDCKKVKVNDYEYYKTKMLLAKKDKDEQVLLAEDQAWMKLSSDSDQEINANMVFMAQIEKVLFDSEGSSSSADEKISEPLKEQLQVKHVVIDTHAECQEKYAKLEAERYEYMIRYSAYFDNDKQHRKQIDDQEVLYDKMSVQLVEMDKHVRDLKNTVLEKDFKILNWKNVFVTRILR
nr:reverse transcriptase domain-containing protein [Tanacetum cinerariifolium]